MMLSPRAALATAAFVSIAFVATDGSGGDLRNASAPWQPPPNCPVTIPNGSAPPGEGSADHHGNGKLWTLLGRRGTFLVARESAPEFYGPNGELAVDGTLGPDGSVGIKAPWWRAPGVRGRVRIQARRLDATTSMVDRTVPPSGYGLTGFQAMGLSLPAMGCWKVTGSVGKARLTFVTLVWRPPPSRQAAGTRPTASRPRRPPRG